MCFYRRSIADNGKIVKMLRPIISETEADKKASWLSLRAIVKAKLIKHLDALGIETAEVM